MSGHFSAYSFVDRITELQPGKYAKGEFQVPVRVARFPSTLVAEAAGQLAAWNAMAFLEYKVRPVAGLASEIRFGPEVRPGQRLDIAVSIDTCELDAVSYSASVDAEGVRVLELDNSVGPMLPMEEFDSPSAVRERFELLCGPGAPSGRFQGVPQPDVEVVERVPEQRVVAMLRVPKEAAFFDDHFPRRPVYPGTLLLDAHIGLSLQFAGESKRWPMGTRFAATRVLGMKMRSFTAPGEILELWVDVDPPSDPTKSKCKTGVRRNGKTVATGGIEITARSSN